MSEKRVTWAAFFSNMFSSAQLRRALSTPRASRDEEKGGIHVAFVLFLEPKERRGRRFSSLENTLEYMIEAFQPAPALLHCELLVPPASSAEGCKNSFATYIGQKSAWQDKADGFNYYLIENIGRWRAVPIFKHGAADLLRAECDREIGVEYSIARYLTALAPFRWTSKLVSDDRRSPAHCASLTARVLRNSNLHMSVRPSASYGPSTLYRELVHAASLKSYAVDTEDWSGVTSEVEEDLEQLLRGVMSRETIASIGDSGCNEVVRALTLRASSALNKGDDSMRRLTQQQLATALLRWTILRDETSGTDAEQQTLPI